VYVHVFVYLEVCVHIHVIVRVFSYWHACVRDYCDCVVGVQ